jgi:hypothetical protein
MGRLLASGAYRITSNHETHTVTMNALVAKRAEILFEIIEAEKRIEQLRTELVHLGAVLRMFRFQSRGTSGPASPSDQITVFRTRRTDEADL